MEGKERNKKKKGNRIEKERKRIWNEDADCIHKFYSKHLIFTVPAMVDVSFTNV